VVKPRPERKTVRCEKTTSTIRGNGDFKQIALRASEVLLEIDEGDATETTSKESGLKSSVIYKRGRKAARRERYKFKNTLGRGERRAWRGGGLETCY